MKDQLDGLSSAAPKMLTRAAQYVRMSREHQRYSIENQSDAIAEYAASHRMQIVRTYADAGVSGLTLRKRAGLLKLLDDVQGGLVDFDVLIAYDVSRWGRFQDTDEAAFYEFMCRRAGIQVVYCAEVFENDGTAVSSLLKTLRRHMAAEYSRDLSTKVNRGLRKQAELGFHVGTAPYGIRRMLIDSRGTPRGLLERGDVKALRGDHTILVPGPPEEVRIVQWVFDLFANQGYGTPRIAEMLNEQGLKTLLGGPWNRQAVLRMINNEKYAGTNVFGRMGSTLGGKRRRAPAENWVRVEGAFEPIVSREIFDRAQTKIVHKPKLITRAQMLEMLRELHARKGQISERAITDEPGIPCPLTFRKKFGSLQAAYEAAGVPVVHDMSFLPIQKALRAKLVESWSARGTQMEADGRASFKLDGRWTFSLFVTTLHRVRRPKAWEVRFRDSEPADVSMIALVDLSHPDDQNFLVMPKLGGRSFYLRQDDRSLDASRRSSFEAAFELANCVGMTIAEARGSEPSLKTG